MIRRLKELVWPPFQTLRSRIVLLMTFALLPLGMISISHTQNLIRESGKLRLSAVMAETLQIAALERELIGGALGASRGLAAAVQTRLGDAAACAGIMRAFVSDNPKYVFASYVPEQGAIDCASSRPPLDLRADPGYRQALATGRPLVVVRRAEIQSPRNMVLAFYPISQTDGALGAIVIGIPLFIADWLLQRGPGEPGPDIVALTQSGDVIGIDGDARDLEMLVPSDLSRAELFEQSGRSFVAKDTTGASRIFAVSPLIAETVTIVGSVPLDATDALAGGWDAYRGLAFPLLMWIAGIGVVSYGVHRLMIRHVRVLQSGMRRFALGERSSQGVRLDSAPEELQDAARSFNRMALILSEAEERANQDLRDKELLLREVHHRVKNNLQFIASIMNIQSRRVQTDEAREMLGGLQRRVRGLATMYSSLYASTEMTALDAAELIRVMVRDMTSVAGSDMEGFSVETDLVSLSILPDQAAPMAMLFAEVLTKAVKHAGIGPSGKKEVRVRLSRRGENEVALRVENSHTTATSGDPQPLGSGLSARLMAAFVDQLEGTAEQEQTEGSYAYTVVFPLKNFDRSGDDGEAPGLSAKPAGVNAA